MEVVHLKDLSKFDETVAAQAIVTFDQLLMKHYLMVLVIQAAKNTSKALFVLFSSDWCPDCKEGDPIVEEVLSERKNCILLHCDVGDRAGYKSLDHPYRKHAQIKLTAIPTLMKWNTVTINNFIIINSFFFF